ncbi:hypothetical protein ONS95_002734 [Cadophora gregata]|uniref:uncharacterized protein n=1 Tax=Cadophora gregata TaxID=51156 RepID=UPI0026DD51BB|nr:uncharacterized protein ONS95_002734 [Cadophora gregata]KAK0110078.1 hypothetical protein ONS95_002734 [Cadophora gregata]KAK0110303.1 hypothetical protein ONS96_001921 [Cadophora gregata f. sp. sojae]
MPTRRTHKKSRLGCQECKKRKVKCSEARPSCSYCIRASCPCVYPLSTSTRVSALKTPPDSTGSPIASPETSTPTEAGAASGPTFDMLDLTLMNHFTAVTALTLFSGEQQRLVWQRDIHYQARSHPVLIHGILSVAAIHLALLEPDNSAQYRLRALHHHDLGVQLFNQQLSNITSETSQTLFPFAVMLVVWAHSSPIIVKEDLQLDHIFHLLELVRGCKTIFMMHWDSISGTPIASLREFVPRLKSHQLILSYVALRAFENLRLQCSDPIYDHAIGRLENVFMKSAGEADDVRTVVAWPCMINEEVWDRLRNKDAMSLFILAHYAMLLEKYEAQWWWINGWSRRILVVVGEVLSDADKAALGWHTFLAHVEEHRQELVDRAVDVE